MLFHFTFFDSVGGLGAVLDKDRNDACRGGKPAGSNFAGHAAHLAEVVLLGNIAIRMNQKLEWDAANLKFPNCPEADKFVNPPYRNGFAL